MLVGPAAAIWFRCYSSFSAALAEVFGSSSLAGGAGVC